MVGPSVPSRLSASLRRPFQVYVISRSSLNGFTNSSPNLAETLQTLPSLANQLAPQISSAISIPPRTKQNTFSTALSSRALLSNSTFLMFNVPVLALRVHCRAIMPTPPKN